MDDVYSRDSSMLGSSLEAVPDDRSHSLDVPENISLHIASNAPAAISSTWQPQSTLSMGSHSVSAFSQSSVPFYEQTSPDFGMNANSNFGMPAGFETLPGLHNEHSQSQSMSLLVGSVGTEHTSLASGGKSLFENVMTGQQELSDKVQRPTVDVTPSSKKSDGADIHTTPHHLAPRRPKNRKRSTSELDLNTSPPNKTKKTTMWSKEEITMFFSVLQRKKFLDVAQFSKDVAECIKKMPQQVRWFYSRKMQFIKQLLSGFDVDYSAWDTATKRHALLCLWRFSPNGVGAQRMNKESKKLLAQRLFDEMQARLCRGRVEDNSWIKHAASPQQHTLATHETNALARVQDATTLSDPDSLVGRAAHVRGGTGSRQATRQSMSRPALAHPSSTHDNNDASYAQHTEPCTHPTSATSKRSTSLFEAVSQTRLLLPGGHPLRGGARRTVSSATTCALNRTAAPAKEHTCIPTTAPVPLVTPSADADTAPARARARASAPPAVRSAAKSNRNQGAVGASANAGPDSSIPQVPIPDVAAGQRICRLKLVPLDDSDRKFVAILGGRTRLVFQARMNSMISEIIDKRLVKRWAKVLAKARTRHWELRLALCCQGIERASWGSRKTPTTSSTSRPLKKGRSAFSRGPRPAPADNTVWDLLGFVQRECDERVLKVVDDVPQITLKYHWASR